MQNKLVILHPRNEQQLENKCTHYLWDFDKVQPCKQTSLGIPEWWLIQEQSTLFKETVCCSRKSQGLRIDLLGAGLRGCPCIFPSLCLTVVSFCSEILIFNNEELRRVLLKKHSQFAFGQSWYLSRQAVAQCFQKKTQDFKCFLSNLRAFCVISFTNGINLGTYCENLRTILCKILYKCWDKQ